MTKSAFLIPEDCEAILHKQLPAILERIASEEGRVGLHLSLVNPTLSIEQVDSFAMYESWSSAFLWEGWVGNVPDGSPFIENARLKAIEAHRHKETLSAVWANRPWVLTSGSVAWYGGVYYDGLSAGVSGLNETSDETVCLNFLEDLTRSVRKKATWSSPQARVTQIREWGGRLP